MNPNALAMMAMQAQMGGAPVQAAPPQQPAPSIPRGLMVPPSPTASGKMRAAVQRGSKAKKAGGNRRQAGAAK